MKEIKKIKIRPINKNLFNIFMVATRSPYVGYMAGELAYFANEDNSIIGVLLFDYTDKDYSYVLTIRDENNQFRAFEIRTDFPSEAKAEEAIKNSMSWHTAQDLKMVEQGAGSQGLKLFDIIVPENKLHPYFKLLKDSKAYQPSKKTIVEIVNHLNDIDGNFVEQFQTLNGFDARIWELYLFATFNELEFEILREYDRPDFMLRKFGEEFGVEAVIVNRDLDNRPTVLEMESPLVQKGKIKDKLRNETPLRFGSALFSKLQKEYWKLPHLKEKPLLFAIADFHDTASMVWSFPALVEYLYGSRQVLVSDEKGRPKVITEAVAPYKKKSGVTIPSGFFEQENTEHISGILFTATGTLGKFTRMGIQAGFGTPGQIVTRIGDCYDHSDKAFSPTPFAFRVDEDGQETWSEGLNLFHNPNAKYPIDMDLFANIAHHKKEKDELISWVPEFHPYSSMNFNTVIKDD